MSAESRSHLYKSVQRRFFRIFLIASAIAILLAIPLVVDSGLRLEVAHRLDLAPGADIERLSDGLDLIVAPIEIQRPGNRPQYRFRAVFLSREVADGVELTSIDTGAKTIVPLQTYDFVSSDPAATRILIQDRRDSSAPRGVLVEVATGSFTTMPPGRPYPDLPGLWSEPVWSRSMGICDGISPQATYIACFQNPKLASFLAGDWELRLRIYGEFERTSTIYRGNGFRPWVGWSENDRWLYFQNEEGIWRAEVTEDMFPPSDRTASEPGQ